MLHILTWPFTLLGNLIDGLLSVIGNLIGGLFSVIGGLFSFVFGLLGNILGMVFSLGFFAVLILLAIAVFRRVFQQP